MNYKNCPRCGRPTPLKEKVTISDGDTLEIINIGTSLQCIIDWRRPIAVPINTRR